MVFDACKLHDTLKGREAGVCIPVFVAFDNGVDGPCGNTHFSDNAVVDVVLVDAEVESVLSELLFLLRCAVWQRCSRRYTSISLHVIYRLLIIVESFH